MRLSACALAFVTAISIAPAAHAATDPEKLFAEATALFEQQKYSEALPRFEEAQRLDPGIGTQFNIAVCYERLGKLASAWRNFDAVVQLARASGKKQREESAKARLESLRPRLSVFTIKSEEPGEVIVKVDGAIVPKATWDFLPVDSGEHRVEASAATKRPWSKTIAAPPEGARQAVVIPKLEMVAGETKVVTVTKETSNPQRTIGYVIGGVGILGAVVAAVTSIMMLDAYSTADEHCDPAVGGQRNCFDQSGRDAAQLGQTLKPINFAAFIVAGVGLVGGAALVLTSPKKTTASIVPFVTADGAALGATGRF